MYYLYRLAIFLARVLPRRVVYFIAFCVAEFKVWVSGRDYQAIIYNLNPIIRDKSRLNVYAKEVFRNFAFYIADFFNFSRIDSHFIKKYITVKGLKNIDDIVRQKKGIILLSAHMGNYELGGAITASLGYDVYVLALPHKDARINKFFNRQRKLFGVNTISTGMSVRKCFRVLRDKKIIAFLGDRSFALSKGKRCKVCGRSALLPKGPAFFAVKSNSFIVPCFFIREQKYFYRFIFESGISPQHNNNSFKTVDEIMKEYSIVLERYIRKYPEQWYVFQKYWL